MNKQKYLEETYQSAFEDELEKFASGGSAVARYLRSYHKLTPKALDVSNKQKDFMVTMVKGLKGGYKGNPTDFSGEIKRIFRRPKSILMEGGNERSALPDYIHDIVRSRKKFKPVVKH